MAMLKIGTRSKANKDLVFDTKPMAKIAGLEIVDLSKKKAKKALSKAKKSNQTGYKADQIIIDECAKINGIGVKEMLEDLEGKIPKKGVESILISTPKKWIKYKNTKKGLKKDPTTIKVGSLTAGIPHAGKYFDFRNLKPVKPTKSRTVKRDGWRDRRKDYETFNIYLKQSDKSAVKNG